MHIVIPDDYQDAVRTLDAFDALTAHQVTVYHDTPMNLDALAVRFADADAIVLIRERTAIPRALIERLPKLKLIAQTGRGIPHIDLDACNDHGVAVSVGGGSPTATAELTWALILAAARRVPQAAAGMKEGRWQTTFGFALKGRTLGIYGYGRIGSVVADYGRAFGMKVVIAGREGSMERGQEDGYEAVRSPRDLFARADVLTLHLKLTNETRGIVTAADLAVMKPGALIVNTSRAELIAPGALVEALAAGRPGLAAVDVYETEPVIDHPLLHMDNVICTPHLGYVEQDSYEGYFGEAFDQVNAFFRGKPFGVINPQAIDRASGS